jgi:hypothetical protein
MASCGKATRPAAINKSLLEQIIERILSDIFAKNIPYLPILFFHFS